MLDSVELSGVIVVRQVGGATDGVEPVPYARVFFTSDTLLVAETEADAAGVYRMRFETDYEFGQVRAEAEGFVPTEQTVFFDTPTRRVDLSLRPSPSE